MTGPRGWSRGVVAAARALMAPTDLGTMPARQVAQLFSRADEHKALMPLAVLLQRQRMAIPTHIASRLATLASHRDTLETIQVSIAGALARLGIAHLFVKGFSVGKKYPQGLPRQFNDIDLLVRDVHQLQPVISALAELGFEIRALGLGRRGTDSPPSVAVMLGGRDGACLPRVEVNFEVLPIYWSTGLLLPDAAWGRPIPTELGPVPAPVDALLIQLAECAERRLQIRDALDLVALAHDVAPGGAQSLADTIHAHFLHTEVATVLASLEQILRPIGPLPAVLAELAARLRPDGLAWLVPSKRLRLLLFHGMPAAGLRGSRAVLRYARAVLMRDAVWLVRKKPRFHQIVCALSDRLDACRELEAGLASQFLILDPHWSGTFAWCGEPTSVLLRSPIGLLAATPLGAVGPRRARMIAAACESLTRAPPAPFPATD